MCVCTKSGLRIKKSSDTYVRLKGDSFQTTCTANIDFNFEMLLSSTELSVLVVGISTLLA